jgi:hypothetical protein
VLNGQLLPHLQQLRHLLYPECNHYNQLGMLAYENSLRYREAVPALIWKVGDLNYDSRIHV